MLLWRCEEIGFEKSYNSIFWLVHWLSDLWTRMFYGEIWLLCTETFACPSDYRVKWTEISAARLRTMWKFTMLARLSCRRFQERWENKRSPDHSREMYWLRKLFDSMPRRCDPIWQGGQQGRKVWSMLRWPTMREILSNQGVGDEVRGGEMIWPIAMLARSCM